MTEKTLAPLRALRYGPLRRWADTHDGRADALSEAVELDERGVADESGDVVVDASHGFLFVSCAGCRARA